MSEGATDLNDLFNLFDVRVAMVDVVMHSSDGGKEGLVGSDVVSKWDGMPGAAEWHWCLNGGTRTYGLSCGWWYVFLVRVVELTGRVFVGVWEVDTGDVGRAVFTDLEESSNTLLDGDVLLLRAY